MQMKTNKKLMKVLGGVFITLGILVGFLICGVIVWGDLEASMFTDGVVGDKAISTLSCPVIITGNETGTISVVVKNKADRDSDRFLRATISEGYATLVREEKTKIPIPANGKQKVEWKIYPEDAAFKSVVLFRVFIPAKYPYPSMSGNCGVVKVNIPWLTGNQVLGLVAVLGLVSLAVGSVMSESGCRPDVVPIPPKTRSRMNATYFLVGSLIAGAALSFFGYWLLGVFALAASTILAGVIIFRC
jgi:hypothetical protein